MGISKQAFYKWKSKLNKDDINKAMVIPVVEKKRINHPGMGLRTIWESECVDFIGRDSFIEIGLKLGLGVKKQKRFKKTTDSRGITRFENLIKDIKLTRINQVWVSDITYYILGGKQYFITLIMDLYSCKVIGYSVSTNLTTEETTLRAFGYAIKFRGINEESEELIIHSDGGGQYYAKIYRQVFDGLNIKLSMAKGVYENPNAERLNRTIKSQYIKRYNPRSYKELGVATAKACLYYNQKPHKALNKLTPDEFEERLKNEN